MSEVDLSEFIAKVELSPFKVYPLSTVESLRAELEELLRLRAQNKLLASEIALTAISCGVIEDQSLTGPQLLLVASDTREAIESFKQDIEFFMNEEGYY